MFHKTAYAIFGLWRLVSYVGYRGIALAIGLILPLSLIRAQEAQNPADRLTPLVQSMEKAEAGVQLPLRVTRQYRLVTPGGSDAGSEVVAEVDFAPPGRYVIQSHEGSGRVEQVVKNILQHEIETARSIQKVQSTALTRQNYDFAYVGKAVLNGRSCHVLQISPKRAQPELISGRAWIDEQSFLIRRIEGTLAKSPSWWIKSVHVDLSFSTFQENWVQTTMDAVAEVRCLGTRELTSHILNYQSAPLAAKNIDRFITLLPAVGAH
jgi:hypothetical protein